MEMSEVKKEIKDYVRDHYKYYGWYPYDVQVGDVLYTYEQYMDILSMTLLKSVYSFVHSCVNVL